MPAFYLYFFFYLLQRFKSISCVLNVLVFNHSRLADSSRFSHTHTHTWLQYPAESRGREGEEEEKKKQKKEEEEEENNKK